MKKTLLAIAFALICFLASAQTPKKVVTDSLTFMPDKVHPNTYGMLNMAENLNRALKKIKF